MKNKYNFPHAATFFFLLTVAVALFSWIGSIYGLGTVQSLLSPEGVRWELRHAIENYMNTPALGIVMILFLGLGIAQHSGMSGAIVRVASHGKQLTRKEKRALVLSGFTFLTYMLMIVLATFAPWTMLRSVTGLLVNSPFEKGIYYLISLGIGLSGIIFGYAADRFRSDRDIICGMSCLFSRYADYFVVLFFIVHFFSSLAYTNLAEWVGIDYKLVHYAFTACCYLPFTWMLSRKKTTSN